MKFYVEGTVFERVEETKAVYGEDGKATGETKLVKSVGFMVEKFDENGNKKKSQLMYSTLKDNEDIKKYPRGTKTFFEVIINPWIDGKRARLSIKQNGDIKTGKAQA